METITVAVIDSADSTLYVWRINLDENDELESAVTDVAESKGIGMGNCSWQVINRISIQLEATI